MPLLQGLLLPYSQVTDALAHSVAELPSLTVLKVGGGAGVLLSGSVTGHASQMPRTDSRGATALAGPVDRLC